MGARILVASLPFAGHVGALAAVSNELVRRGHDVVVHTGAKYAKKFTGARWLPWTQDFDDAELAQAFPRVGDGKGMRANMANFQDVLIGTSPGQTNDILTEDFDLVVTDYLAFGASMAAELRGVPWVTVAVTPLALPSRHLPPAGIPVLPATNGLERLRDKVLRAVVETLTPPLTDPMFTRMRAKVGLPGQRAAFVSTFSRDLVLAQGVQGLDYHRPDLPEHVHFVGRLNTAADSSHDLPEWWPELEERKVVHVTQGTLQMGADDLLKPTIEAMAGHEALVVCTTGGAPIDTLGPLPSNVRAAPFIPHDLLLPLTDVMVTNGGWGGVLAAVHAGTALVVVPGELDKPEVARRVQWSGVGVQQKKTKHLREAIDQVLAEPRHRQRAQELGRALAAAGGATKAGELIDELLRRR